MMLHTLLFILLLFSASVSSAQNVIPDVDLSTLTGKNVNIRQEVSGDKITVLSFWATWCVPCINELDAISDVYEEWQEETGVELIAVSVDDARTQKKVSPLMNGKGWDYKILLDINQTLKRALNISVVPCTIVLKGEQIIYKHTGYTPGTEDELYEVIQAASKKD